MTEGAEWTWLIFKKCASLAIIIAVFALAIGALPYMIFFVVMWALVKSNK